MLTKVHLVAAAALLALVAAGCQAQAVGNGSDEITTQQVLARLNQHSDLKTDDIHAQALDGVVYLHGLVDSDLEAQQAEALALSVPNVRQVVNELATEND